MEHIVNPFLARQESYHNVLSCGEELYLGGGGAVCTARHDYFMGVYQVSGAF